MRLGRLVAGIVGCGLGIGLAGCSQGAPTATTSTATTSTATTTSAASGSSTATTTTAPAAVVPAGPAASTAVGPIATVSRRCPAQNAEVENAAYPARDEVFEDWIGCSGIEFVRSTDGGRTYSAPVLLPGSPAVRGGLVKQSWDPAIAVGPDGTVYASFMVFELGRMFPVVEVSSDGGATFSQPSRLMPSVAGNWGDRDFIAVGRDGRIYVSWDYGPSLNEVHVVCPSGGSCGFSRGDLNIVVQASSDGGRTWGPMHLVGSGFPSQGGDGAPLLVGPDGTVYLVYQGHAVDHGTLVLGPSRPYFSSSHDGGSTWTTPVPLGPASLTMATTEWWIDGSLGADSSGDLYFAWDTQSASGDVGWLTYSTDHGATWSPLVRATPDHDAAPHIIEVAGDGPGRAAVAWLSTESGRGYALYLRPFSVAKGWLSAPVQVSPAFGASTVWPGDTFGITPFPATVTGGTSVSRVALTWGSALASEFPLQSAVLSAVATLTVR